MGVTDYTGKLMQYADYAIRPALELGLNQQKMDELVGRVKYAVESGPLPSIQIALARDGKLALFQTYGKADNTTRYNIFSCTKPLVASAIWLLMGKGLIDIDQSVGHYIPEFSDTGKQAVTVAQLLCHTSGFPRAPMGPPEWWTREGRLQRMRRWHLDWEPGSQMEYHAASAHWVLTELIEVLTGSDYREFIRNSIISPLGLQNISLGGEGANQGKIAQLRNVGDIPSREELVAHFGRPMNWPDMADDSMLSFNEARVRTLGVPGGGAVANAADMALFYQSLMRNPGELWQPEILADAVGRVRVDFPDPMTGVPANRGLGVVIAGGGDKAAYRGMGRTVSPSAFGHRGVGGQVSWADPASGISFCMLTNGLDANPLRSARFCASVNNRAGAAQQQPQDE
jgi:CubicO group peptidase (beta-lactamase class C family)